MSADVVVFKIKNTKGLRLAAALLVWPAASLLVGTRIGLWVAGMANYSFFIFLLHAPIVASWAIYSRYGAALLYLLYWMSAPLLATRAADMLVSFFQQEHADAVCLGAQVQPAQKAGKSIALSR